jgi:hydrogenase maturation protease
MSEPRILIAGIGNIFLGDDAFGVEVARRLVQRQLPEGVRVVDFGIRGFDLAYALMDEYEATILVDAAPQGGPPGTVYAMEIDTAGEEPQAPGVVEMETHGMNPMRVLEMVRAMGGQPKRILLVGCEPQTLGDPDEGTLGLSGPVEAAIEPAIAAVNSLVAGILGAGRTHALAETVS